MKVPEKLVPLLFGLLLIAVYLIGRYQAQAELLRGGGLATQTAVGQTAPQTVQTDQTGGGDTRTVITQELWDELTSSFAASIGSENAPVTMVEFTDYQCPFCARYFTNTHPQIVEEYIDTGKLRYLVRDLPLPIHPNAPAAAMAARCAGDQGKYWEMHDLLFNKQTEWQSGNTSEMFPGYAVELGLNSGEFTSCVTSEKYKDQISEDQALAQRIGASGTPAFIINKELVIGAQPFTAFQQVIERAQ